MKEPCKILILFLTAKFIVCYVDCPIKSNEDKCECATIEPDNHIDMNCTLTHFRISYLVPKFVKVRCEADTDWSDFQYNLRSELNNIKEFFIENCTLEKNTSVIEIAKLTGAESAQVLSFINNYDKEFKLWRTNFVGFSHVGSLFISNNRMLTRLEEDLLNDLSNLKTITISSNKIKEISKNFFQNVTKITDLVLHGNLIESLYFGTFKGLKKLNSLNLVANTLMKIESHTFDDLVSLKILDLQSNRLETLPQKIFDNLKALEVISLSYNNFESVPEDLFKKNVNLWRVQLHNNGRPLKTLPNRLFSNLSKLREVALFDNGMFSLPENLFEGSSALEKISLNLNNLKFLPDNLFKSAINLKELDLSDNELKTISGSLFNGLSSLEILYMDFNKISTVHRNAFESGLNKLRIINLSHNKISDLKKRKDTSGKYSIFEECKSLQELNLSFNNLSEIYIDLTVTDDSILRHVDISGNPIVI